jgi:hypothetical protein
MNNRRILVVSLLAILLLAACGGGAAPAGDGGGAQSGGATPADVARQFFEAVYSGGDISPLVCTAAADAVESMREGLASIAASGATVDVSGLTYTTQNESGDTAEVLVSGTIKVSISGVDSETPFPETPIPMRNENGWKVCG